MSNKKVKHTPKENIYCGVLQYRSTLQPYILLRVGLGVELWAWTTLQPYNTNLPTNRNCLQQWLSRQYSLKSPLEKKRGGAVRKSLTIFCLPEKVN